ncbi:holin [Microbacterium sp. KR10-403]|uniref:holin n=1 Tax=Microbacterium sp. KR10-403 TaxID=3158581 RepID=UPI0032E4BA3A
MKTITSVTWWEAAVLRAVYTALAIALPYLGGALLTSVPWLTIASAGALGFVASLLTSLAGIPEADGVDLPWWLAAVERVVKTFAQALAAGFLGATLLTDVAWSTVLQAAAIAALTSLVRLILATLPQDPTAPPIDAGTADGDTVPVVTTVPAAAKGIDPSELTD